MHRRLAPAALAAVLALAAPGPAGAAPVKLGFDAYGGGLFLVHGDIALEMGDGAYRMTLEATGGRFVDLLTRWSYRAEGSGRVDGPGRVAPAEFVGERRLRSRTNRTELRHDGTGGVAVTYRPPSADDLDAVPPALRRDALDPVAAAVAVLSSVRSGTGCAGGWPVYDGRRRYEIRAEPRGTETLAPNRYSSFSGPARRCAVTMRPVAGFDPPSKGTVLREGQDRTADIWFAPAAPGGEEVPVRVQVDLDWGGLVLHLVSAERP
jgi:hypothetical protein